VKETQVTKAVRERYGNVARQGGSCCSGNAKQGNSCCGIAPSADEASKRIGYSDAEIAAVPSGANLGLGCGNPTALASLKPGETVLDLGSGGGFDCFLAAGQVGDAGHVIGVDMTPDMIDCARDNIQKSGYTNVEFRLGEIEHLPVADASIDAIISNCVINLSQHKDLVFAEAFRVLKPGGRLIVSDMVLLSPLPAEVKTSLDAYVSCVAGAALKEDYLAGIRQAGFKDVTIASEDHLPIELMTCDPNIQALIKEIKPSQEQLRRMADTVVSVKVSALKPIAKK
jgi:arsenite methyltransferase